MAKAKHDVEVLEKCPTGIRGLDEITKGGLPKGRPTLICGSAGCGKTLFAMEFLMRGARDYGEPGVFMAFEETPEMVAGEYDFFVMEYYSHLHERMADPIVLPREAEVYRSRPYPHAGGETRLRVFDLAKVREAP